MIKIATNAFTKFYYDRPRMIELIEDGDDFILELNWGGGQSEKLYADSRETAEKLAEQFDYAEEILRKPITAEDIEKEKSENKFPDMKDMMKNFGGMGAGSEMMSHFDENGIREDIPFEKNFDANEPNNFSIESINQDGEIVENAEIANEEFQGGQEENFEEAERRHREKEEAAAEN
jgi:hypothetical protein